MDNGSTREVDINFPQGLSSTSNCQLAFTGLTTPAAPQSRNWDASVDTLNVSNINVNPATSGSLLTDIVGPPQFLGKILKQTNATFSSPVTMLYQIVNPAGSKDVLTSLNIPILTSWTGVTASASTGNLTMGLSAISVTGLNVASTPSQDAYVNLTIVAQSPATSATNTFYWDATVNTVAYPTQNTLIADADTDLVKVALTAPVSSTKMDRNYINPFKGETVNLTYAIGAVSDVFVGVYNVAGQLVYTWVNDKAVPIGTKVSIWDGKVDKESLASGVYVIYIQIGSYKETRKLIIIK